jgi:hypothetical protein
VVMVVVVVAAAAAGGGLGARLHLRQLVVNRWS